MRDFHTLSPLHCLMFLLGANCRAEKLRHLVNKKLCLSLMVITIFCCPRKAAESLLAVALQWLCLIWRKTDALFFVCKQHLYRDQEKAKVVLALLTVWKKKKYVNQGPVLFPLTTSVRRWKGKQGLQSYLSLCLNSLLVHFLLAKLTLKLSFFLKIAESSWCTFPLLSFTLMATLILCMCIIY